MTPLDLIAEARATGHHLAPRGDRLHVEPVPPPELLQELAAHKAEILALLLDERRRQISRLLEAIFDRMSALSPWTAEEVAPHHDLGDEVDQVAKAFVAGESELGDVEVAIARWETSLRAGKGLKEPNRVPNAMVQIGGNQRGLFEGVGT